MLVTPPPKKPDDRDVYVEKHSPTPPAGTPVFVEEECTGQVDGDELAARRAKRSTDDRIARLEVKHDSIQKSVSRMEGKLDTALDFIRIKTGEDGKTARVKISTNGKVMIAIVTAAIMAISTVLVAVLR